MTDTNTMPDAGDTTPAPDAPTAAAVDQSAPAQEIDWKAEARKWETRAKENRKAAEELARLKQQQMTEAERLAAEAEQRGRAEAAREYGARLARAELRAAAASKGIDLGDALDLIDATRFVGEDGEVDEKAIADAVAKLTQLAQLATPKAGASGADFAGGNGGGTPARSLQDQIREAEAKGDWKTARRLKTHLLVQQ